MLTSKRNEVINMNSTTTNTERILTIIAGLDEKSLILIKAAAMVLSARKKMEDEESKEKV